MRLINADNLIRHKFPPERSNDEFARGWNTAIDAIVHNVPEVVANPTVYGRWIEVSRTEYEYDTEIEEKCSVCGRYVRRYDTQPHDNFCPNCGAKMRGVSNG